MCGGKKGKIWNNGMLETEKGEMMNVSSLRKT